MRVFAVPSGRFSSAATCSCVRSSRKARLSAWRWGGGSSSNADWMMARRRSRDAASGGPGSRAGSPSSTRPSGSGTMSGWRLRRRSSFRTRKCAIWRIHARTVPRSGSKREALRQTARKTSCTRSSAVARSSVCAASPKISRAKRRWSRASASGEPPATRRIRSSSAEAFSVDAMRRCPLLRGYIAMRWGCEGIGFPSVHRLPGSGLDPRRQSKSFENGP